MTKPKSPKPNPQPVKLSKELNGLIKKILDENAAVFSELAKR